jgi:hypothetical protein
MYFVSIFIIFTIFQICVPYIHFQNKGFYQTPIRLKNVKYTFFFNLLYKTYPITKYKRLNYILSNNKENDYDTR